MQTKSSAVKTYINNCFTYFGCGIRAKLIVIFVIIKVIPLVLLAFVAWTHSWELGEAMRERIAILSTHTTEALKETGDLAVADATIALDTRATLEIERSTTDLANEVARFLYARDGDIRFLANINPNTATYKAFINNITGNVVIQTPWELSPDKSKWQPVAKPSKIVEGNSSNKENDLSFQYRQPDAFDYENRPIFLEATFIGLDGMEQIKVTNSKQMNANLKNVSRRTNTYVKAETYFPKLKKLKAGEIYVSDVIGAYVGSKIINYYTPATAKKAGIPYEPEKSAWAGQENPVGKRFKGIVRWGMPVEKNGVRIGYVTLALDHDHIMEIIDHVMPTPTRYTELPDAAAGNYAFIWDYKGRSIVHPRHFSIVGYDPKTGNPQIPWLEASIYKRWQTSKKSYIDFIADEPTFVEQSTKKKPSIDLIKAGLVGLDCRYLNFAPQCTGWFDLARDGGSGSFVILWSGLRKLTTAAAIPYYTGQYAASGVGFGFVAVGAEMDDFRKPAEQTRATLDALIANSNAELDEVTEATYEVINESLLAAATSLALSTILMIVLVIFIAIWMASAFTRTITALIDGILRMRNGERNFRFNSTVRDELGALADAVDDSADALEQSVITPLVILDMEENIIYMNEHALKRLNIPLADVIGKPYAEFAPYEIGSIHCPLAAIHEHHDTAIYNIPETASYMQDTATYFYDKQDQALGYMISSTDLTEIIFHQRQVEEQSILLNTMFSASEDLIWLKTIEGKYLYLNSNFATYLGKEVSEIVGEYDHSLTAGNSLLNIEKDLLVIESNESNFTEQRITFSDGTVKIVDSVRIPIFDADGKVISILGMARDVSQRVKVERELRETQQFLEASVQTANHANNSKSDFLARMSHEIRTPMNAIMGMTTIVQRKLNLPEASPKSVLGQLKQIEVSSKHLLGLLNDILDISKIEAGKIELAAESFDLTKLITIITTIIKPRCDEKNIRFIVEQNTLDDMLYISDPLRLRQVLINLLGNAAKFTPQLGKIHFMVKKTKEEAKRSFIEISITDSGIGIAEANMSKLFKPFEQADKSIAAQFGGTGLGLAISQSIVELLGSKIEVESVFGKGSTFHFGIWLEHAHESLQEANSKVASTAHFEGKRILLIDDVAINRIIVADLLESFNFEIDEAVNGMDGYTKFSTSPEGHYDIIFMDVLMPIMNGYEATEAIRSSSHADAQSVPILAMTANAFREDIDEAIASGMNAHIAKPIEYDKLVEFLVQYIPK